MPNALQTFSFIVLILHTEEPQTYHNFFQKIFFLFRFHFHRSRDIMWKEVEEEENNT